MFLRSLVVAISLAALSFTAAQAAWFWQKPRAEEAQQAAAEKAKAKVTSTGAYVRAMRVMHKNMHGPRSGDVDVDFVRQMIPHHQAALEMARIQQKFGKDEELKKFNDWVIMAQTQEIAFMQNWLRRRDNGASCSQAANYFGESMMTMHKNMAIKYTGNADLDYVRGMIAHHQGAVDMAAILLDQGTDPDLNDLANNIFDSQTYEISWMQGWLEENSPKRP